MGTDLIEALGIEDCGSLWVKPTTSRFPYICREAMGVNWDARRLCLHGPMPRGWSYPRWFWQIVAAAREQGVELKLAPTVRWSNITAVLQTEIAISAKGN